MMINLRSPRPDEVEMINALMLRAKAHWGYDAAFMVACADVLRVTSDDLRDGCYAVAVDCRDYLLGVHGVDIVHLDKLFVDPGAMGHGAGKMLFGDAVRIAREAGCTTLRIESDPDAKPFYQRMGAIRVGEAPSEAIPGRMLPLLEFRLTD